MTRHMPSVGWWPTTRQSRHSPTPSRCRRCRYRAGSHRVSPVASSTARPSHSSTVRGSKSILSKRCRDSEPETREGEGRVAGPATEPAQCMRLWSKRLHSDVAGRPMACGRAALACTCAPGWGCHSAMAHPQSRAGWCRRRGRRAAASQRPGGRRGACAAQSGSAGALGPPAP
eukprot:scaffold14471_cov113-Isochrysis_galbana.AAC.6